MFLKIKKCIGLRGEECERKGRKRWKKKRKKEDKSLVSVQLEGLSLYHSSQRLPTFREGKVTSCAQALEQTNCQLVVSPTGGLHELS